MVLKRNCVVSSNKEKRETMQINSINNLRTSPSFQKVYVTTSTKNNGDFVEKEVIDPFKKFFMPSIARMSQCKDFESIIDDTDFYVLAAGEGSRFRQLAATEGSKVNKISFSEPLQDGRRFHMLDIAMAMSVPFADQDGLIRKNAEVARGSFAEIYDNARILREKGLPQKNIVVCCGDNLFHTDKPFELDYFMKDVIEDPTKQMGLVGVEREPEEVVNRFGVLDVIPTNKDDVMKLNGFVEKPKTESIAREFETPNGKCIANTGMFTIKAEAMEWLMDELEKDPMFIAKNEKEPYDFAAACTKVQEKYGANKCDVKLVQTWEDAGEPEALYRTIKEFQKGNFLTNFSPKDRMMIQSSMKKDFDGKTLLATINALNAYGTASRYTNMPIEKDGVTITNIEGVDVIV